MGDGFPNVDIEDSCANRSKRGLLPWLFWIGFFLFVVYPLSTGPAALLAKNVPSTNPAFTVLYAPIEFLADHCDPFAEALIWYLTTIWKVPFP